MPQKRFNAAQALRQWFACAGTFLDIPKPLREKLQAQWADDPPDSLTQWYQQFRNDLFCSKNGYPIHPVAPEPYTEIQVESILKDAGVWQECDRQVTQPALCLSHDIDYLAPTLQMVLKRSIAQRKLSFYPKEVQFMDSLETLLRLDKEAAGKNGVSTLFVPYAFRSRKPWRWPAQWLIDPSYHETHPQFYRLSTLIEQFECEVGLHGSFYSLTDSYIDREREALSKVLNRSVQLVRQHWLNLPSPNALTKIRQAGFPIDSTLGWNGEIGFRGGMARPYPILLESGETLWEVPLLLMDGPMFDDLKMDSEECVSTANRMLGIVLERGGCVSINWHERAAFPDYNWHFAYETILRWAKNKGFQFQNIRDAVKHGQSRANAHDTDN